MTSLINTRSPLENVNLYYEPLATEPKPYNLRPPRILLLVAYWLARGLNHPVRVPNRLRPQSRQRAIARKEVHGRTTN